MQKYNKYIPLPYIAIIFKLIIDNAQVKYAYNSYSSSINKEDLQKLIIEYSSNLFDKKASDAPTHYKTVMIDYHCLMAEPSNIEAIANELKKEFPFISTQQDHSRLSISFNGCPYIFLSYTDNPNYHDELTRFIKEMDKMFYFIDIAECVDGFQIYLSENGLEDAKEFIENYGINFKNNSLKDKKINYLSYRTLLGKFTESVNKLKNLQDYKLVATNHLLVILSAWINKLVAIDRFSINFRNPEKSLYSDKGELRNNCLKCSLTIDLSKFAMKYFKQYTYDAPKGKYTAKQRMVLNRIIELKHQRLWGEPIAIGGDDIAEIYGCKFDEYHRISEIVRKLNKAFREENHTNILGRKEKDGYYPILFH